MAETLPINLDLREPRAQAAADPCRHLTFLGDQAPPVPAAAPRPLARVSGSREERVLDAESAAFFEALCQAGGIRAARYRHTILRRRQAACLRALRAPSLGEARRLIAGEPGRAEKALGAVMIGVTAFFRDPAVFEALSPLMRVLRHEHGRVDAVSVACSDGSELYSVAMLAAEERAIEGATFLGIDCRPLAIEAARAGHYTSACVAAVPEPLRSRYFVAAAASDHRPRHSHEESFVRVAETLRGACRWKVGDAFDLPPHSDLRAAPNIILCRNLAIYLTPAAAEDLWRLLVASVRPGGLLVVGKAERPSPDTRALLTRVGPCIYRKLENP